MLIADGANTGKIGRNKRGPAEYGRAIKIYRQIQKATPLAKDSLLHRLALAISLEHSVPISQSNPKAETNPPATIDPLARFHHYKTAFENRELDPAFARLTTWDRAWLSMVMNRTKHWPGDAKC